MSQRRAGNKSRNLTQQTLTESDGEFIVNVDEVANNVVRYIIYRAGEHMNFTKAELMRNVIKKAGNKYEDIITQVRKTLQKVYGLNIIVCDATKGKDRNYVISNILPYVTDPSGNPEEIPDDVNSILLLLILSHIFMANLVVSDVSLYGFLKSVGIDVDLRHDLFGNVKEYINKTLTKKQYLIIEIDSISRRQTFKWGLRAEKEVSKKAILEFVCKMYRDRQPKQWVNQFQIASEQAYENYQENRNVPMETESQDSQEE